MVNMFRRKKERLPEIPGPIYLDATPESQDWIKGTWDLPPVDSEEYRELKRLNGNRKLRPASDLPDGESGPLRKS